MYRGLIIAIVFYASGANATDRFNSRHSLMPTPAPQTERLEPPAPSPDTGKPQLPVKDERVVLKPLEEMSPAREMIDAAVKQSAPDPTAPATAYISSYLNIATAKMGVVYYHEKYPQLLRLSHKIEPLKTDDGKDIFRLVILGQNAELARLCEQMGALGDSCVVE